MGDDPALSDGPYQIEIRRHRFQSYGAYQFDRLVIEFVEHGRTTATPTVRIMPHVSSKEVSIQVESAALIGAIPESKINSSYSNSSRYLGPLAINTDDPGTGFTIRAFLKSSDSVVDAFWLTAPRRLVVDAFPRSSPRAEGPHVINHRPRRGVASKYQASVTTPSEPVEAKPNFYCFPTGTKVSAIVKFKGKHAYLSQPESTGGEVTEAEANEVSCFPANAALLPTISYAEGVVTIQTGINKSPASTSAPVLAPPAPKPAPVVVAPPPAPPTLATMELVDEGDLFGAGAGKDDKDAPPPIQQEPQRIPTSPINLTPAAKKAAAVDPKTNIQGLLPPVKK